MRIHKSPALLYCSLAVSTLVTSSSVLAQETGSRSHGMDISEIVVSAQRRSESLQDVPISITALNADLLSSAGIATTRDLELVTPGLKIDAVGTYVQPAIRGISTTITSTTEANVATYIDGVYQAAQLGAFYELPDVRQIEVLKGPQGTLFGRNSTGGAILIHTLEPDLDQTTGSLSAGYSSFDTISAKGFVSVPLVDEKVAFSLSGLHDNMREGYLRDLVRGGKTGEIETNLVRAKLLFLPWDGAEFTLSGLYSDREDHTALAGSNWRGNVAVRDAAVSAGVPIATKPHQWASDVDVVVDTTIKNVSLSGSVELGPGTLSLTTAYQENEMWLVMDSDNSPFKNARAIVDSNFEVFSQELIYATNQFDRVRAIGGLYYYDKDAFQIFAATALDANGNWTNRMTFGVQQTDRIKAKAVFGEVTVDVTDRLAITAGLRYSHEDVEAYAASALSPHGPEPLGKKTWTSVDPRVSLSYQLNDRSNLYFTYSQGFKSGVFNTPGLQSVPVDPENVDAYEIGFKGQLTDSVSLNTAAFFYDYTDLQQTSIVTLSTPEGDLLVQELRNAANAEIYGAEATIVWQPSERFSLSLSSQYLHAQFEKFPDAVANRPQNNPFRLVPTAFDASGNTMIRSPEWTASVTATYTQDTRLGPLTYSGTLFGSTKIYYNVDERIHQPSYEKLNVKVSWRPHNSQLEISIWGKNLTDTDTLASVTSSTAYDNVTYAPPRSFGVDIAYAF